MSETKNLGLVKAIHSGETPPSNTEMIWYNTGVNAYTQYRQYYYDTDTSSWVLLGGSGIMFYEFTTGALVKGVTKTVSHNQGLTNYFINARDISDNNNAMLQILKPNAADPSNAIDIKSYLAVPSPGLTIQIMGI